MGKLNNKDAVVVLTEAQKEACKGILRNEKEAIIVWSAVAVSKLDFEGFKSECPYSTMKKSYFSKCKTAAEIAITMCAKLGIDLAEFCTTYKSASIGVLYLLKDYDTETGINLLKNGTTQKALESAKVSSRKPRGETEKTETENEETENDETENEETEKTEPKTETEKTYKGHKYTFAEFKKLVDFYEKHKEK